MIKLNFKIIALLVTLIVLSIIFLKYKLKTKSIEKYAGKIEKDPAEAERLSQSLGILITEFEADSESVKDKLQRLKYQLDVLDHRIYACHAMAPNTFLLITIYEYIDTSKAEPLEKLFSFYYKVIIEGNKVKFFTDNLTDEKKLKFKQSFVNAFCKDFLKISV